MARWLWRVAPVALVAWIGSPSYAKLLTLDRQGRTGATFTARPRLSSDFSIPSEVAIHAEIHEVRSERTADGFDRVKIDGLTPLEVEGQPEMQTAGVLVAVPEGFEPDLSVDEAMMETLRGIWPAPAQPLLRCDCDLPDNPFAFDPSIYLSTKSFPSELAVLQEAGRFQGLRLVRVGLFPMRLQMASGDLSVARVLRVKVSFRANGKPPRRHTLTPAGYRLIRAATANGTTLDPWVQPTKQPERMWIITPRRYHSSLLPLVRWKNQRGIDTRLIDFDNVGGTPERLQLWLRKRFEERSFDHLLLVGDRESLPGFIEETHVGPGPSDFRYALMDGEGDPLPDIFYGRLLAHSEEDVATQVERIVQYERSPFSGAWFDQAVVVAGEEGARTSDEEYARRVQSSLLGGGFRSVDLLLQGLGTATHSSLARSLEEGRSFLAYFGHGDGVGWKSFNRTADAPVLATSSEFRKADLDAIDNRGHLPWVIDIACRNADWYGIDRPFGMNWMTHQRNGGPAGAIAYYGGSVNVTWHPPAVMAVGAVQAYSRGTLPLLGPTLYAGQLHMLGEMGIRPATLNNLRWFNLFGDPSLMIRSSAPVGYRVQIDRGQSLLGDFLSVHIEGLPAHGSVQVALTQEQSLLATAVADERGVATFPQPTGPAVVTTSGPGLESYSFEVDNGPTELAHFGSSKQ